MLLLTLTSALATRPTWDQLGSYTFSSYVEDFNKPHLIGTDVWNRRQAVFEAQLRHIKEHNAKTSSYKMGVNQFTDQEPSEISRMLGFNKRLSQHYKKQNAAKVEALPLPTAQQLRDLPTSVDWRKHDFQVVSGVKDQGGCGSCWAFASTETVESHVALNTKQLMVLSPQQLVSCSTNPNHCGGTGGCAGSVPGSR